MELNEMNLTEVKKGMIPLTKGISHTQDDKEVLRIIEIIKWNLEARGAKFPEMDLSKDVYFPFVYYYKGFNLCLVVYIAKEEDAGYMAFHFDHFLTENKFNVKSFQPMTNIDVTQLLEMITIQATGIAKQMNYPLTISTAITKDFMGLVAMAEHPLEEATNMGGTKN